MAARTADERSLRVPGARIHHEVRGSGPLLLLVPGGPQDAGVLADLGRRLADRYTTVAYDPRGNSRSVLDTAPENPAHENPAAEDQAPENQGDQRLDVHADDAARFIRALGGGPAHVFGTSGGAQIALALAARSPELVRTVVAHEPSCVMLLDDPSEALARDRGVHETCLREGVEAEWPSSSVSPAWTAPTRAPRAPTGPGAGPTRLRTTLPRR
ncbi:alpha/beta fold hydrolase [Nocardiopsis nanhaiensis]